MAEGVANSQTDGQWTFLQIVQRYVQDCGIASSSAVPLPTTVVNQVGELKRAVDNCAEAWFDIQSLHINGWRFKRTEFTFEVIDGQQEYTYQQAGIDPGTFGDFALNSFRSYPTSVGLIGEVQMDWMPWDDFRDTYKLAAVRFAKSRPIQWSKTPYDGIALGPTPLAGYTILGDFFRAPIRMDADDDVPELPFKHSPLIIVYHAMLTYGYFEAAPEVVEQARQGYRRLLNKLELDQLETFRIEGALA